MRTLFAFLALGALALSAASADEPKRGYPWQKPPGPIAGQWKVTCPYMNGMIVEFTVDGEKAIGKIAVLGEGGARTYKQGEEILVLQADDFGEWFGKLVWRSAAGAQHVDAIRFTASKDKLNARMTTDECYKDMPRIK